MPDSFELPLQHDCVASRGALLAVGSSALGGNDWEGTVTFFAEDFAHCRGAVHIPAGVPCVAWMTEEVLAAACDDGVARIVVDGRTGAWNEAASVGLHDSVVAGVACSGNLLCTASWDGTCKLFDVGEGRTAGAPVMTLKHTDGFNAVVWTSPTTLAAAASDCVVLWDTRASDPARKRTFASRPTSLAFDGHRVVAGFANGDVVRLAASTEEGDEKVCKHAAKVCALAAGEAGALLSGSDDGVVFGLGEHRDFVRGACFWRGRPLTASWDGLLTLW